MWVDVVKVFGCHDEEMRYSLQQLQKCSARFSGLGTLQTTKRQHILLSFRMFSHGWRAIPEFWRNFGKFMGTRQCRRPQAFGLGMEMGCIGIDIAFWHPYLLGLHFITMDLSQKNNLRVDCLKNRRTLLKFTFKLTLLSPKELKVNPFEPVP